MPRDIKNDSLAVLRIIEHEDEENWPSEDDSCGKQLDKKIVNPTTKKCEKALSKDDSDCYFNYGHGEGTTCRQQDLFYQYKTCSLPSASSINQSWDKIVCSAIQLSPEDIANQLSLLDMPCFKAIQLEELTTCGWNKLNKLTVAPNVVAFTKRFNRVSFWTVQEILNNQSPKARAETLAHFIKVGKKLHELNNLHSLFAIISALQSASIYRLSKTWASLSKKDKQQFDKLAMLFGDKDNWLTLREYLRSISLPCIPYLGIFLTDLIYIDMAHPVGSPHRASKMVVVLQALQRYQTSQYNITPLPYVANYLNSVRYIEELQKFLEDDQYKLSLKLEPPSPVESYAGSKESVKETTGKGCGIGAGCSAATCTHVSPSYRLGSGSLQLACQSKYISSHRKCLSLGSNIFGKAKEEERETEYTPTGSVNLLDDTLLESPGVAIAPVPLACLPESDLSRAVSLPCDFESYVRRKTILKEGKKISLSSWKRFWLELAGTVLVFYASKSFKGTSRSDFRAEYCKVVPLSGWTALPEPPNGFHLLHRRRGTAYKFKTGSDAVAKHWVTKIEEISNNMEKPLPANLMSFE